LASLVLVMKVFAVLLWRDAQAPLEGAAQRFRIAEATFGGDLFDAVRRFFQAAARRFDA
jgi:hypothetical protein